MDNKFFLEMKWALKVDMALRQTGSRNRSTRIRISNKDLDHRQTYL